jgi:5-methylcytosine-specific restriction endonuclease McrA
METEHEGMVLLDRILENSPTWSPKGSRVDPYMGVDEWTKVWMWHHIRSYVLERDGHTCQVCGEHEEEVQVHHIVWKSHNGSDHPKNLMVVCERCHRQIHARELPLMMYQ